MPDINEIKADRAEMENELLEILTEFESRNGVRVDYLNFDRSGDLVTQRSGQLVSISAELSIQ